MEKEVFKLAASMSRAELCRFLMLIKSALYRRAKRGQSW